LRTVSRKLFETNFEEDEAEDAKGLAYKCARNEPDAVDKVNEILAGIGLNMDQVLDDAKGGKAKELVQEYVRREPAAVNLVDKRHRRR
jgi:hypothetical protein